MGGIWRLFRIIAYLHLFKPYPSYECNVTYASTSSTTPRNMAEIVWYQVSKDWSPARTCTGSWDGYPQCFIVQRPECNLYCPYFCGKSTHVIHSQRVTQMEINGIRQLKASIRFDNRCVLQTAGCGDTFRKTINDRNKVNSANSIPNRINKGYISRCFVVVMPSFSANMMTSSNGNNFRVTGHLCGEFTGHRWIPCTKTSDADLWCFLWSVPE